MVSLPQIETVILITIVFLIAGFVKGVIGLGLPSIALALLTATLGLTSAMAILVLPSLFTNLWQGVYGGKFFATLKEIRVYIVIACLATWVGTEVLTSTNPAKLSILLGLILAFYAVASLTGFELKLKNFNKIPVAIVFGSVSGTLTGMTGSFVFPAVIYLQTLNLPPRQFIQAMGITFTMATLSLGASLGGQGFLPIDLIFLSAIALVPSFVGLAIGNYVRGKLNDHFFKRVFFVGLLLVGLIIILRSYLLG
ncbi:MAG: sulfite exporter TauE/SafE family protein [Pseudomonadota bacterium]|nr:sulfite exporter TauE/SafE family protein [Pseudomonadota bacterium]